MYRTIWLNAFFLLDGTCNSVVELSNSTGWDFDSTIKFNASTGEEHCEWFVCGVCGTEVALDIKQVGFTVSSLFSPRPASYSRMEVILATLHCCWMQWEKKLSHEVGQDRNCSHNRAAKHMKISCLSRKSSLNYSWCSWILPQAIRDIQHACKTSAHVQGLYFQIGGCECELHNKNACFWAKINFISIQNFKAGNVKPPGMHWSKDF